MSNSNNSNNFNVYLWVCSAILIYHVSSVFLFHSVDTVCMMNTNNAISNSMNSRLLGSGSIGSSGDASNLQQQQHPNNNNNKNKVPKLRQSLRDFIPTDPTTLSKERSVSCVRWNYTYVFPKAPAFIIIGTQKGGTSALSALLDLHPWMESSWYFEPHFFDFNEIMLQYKFRLSEPESRCKLLRTYLQKNYDLKKLRKYPNLLAFEKTPAYILTPNAPKRIKATVPWSKIIVTLRNPVDRLISQHKMTVMRHWENRTFAETLAEDINVMRHEGFWLPMVDPMNTSFMGPPEPRPVRKYKTEGMLYRGMYARQLLPWLDEYELGTELMVIQYEKLKSQPDLVLNEVLDFVGAPLYNFPPDVVNKSYSPSSSSWKTQYDPDIDPELLDYIKQYYKPYNEELADLLGEQWRNVWD